MTPIALYIPFLQEALTRDPFLSTWLKQNKRRFREIVAHAALSALLQRGNTEPERAYDAARSTQQERAHRFVWSKLAEDQGAVIAHGAIPLFSGSNADAFIEQTRKNALLSAQRRRSAGEPTVEAAYVLLLRWLGAWDAAFDAAQSEAAQRAERDAMRVREIRESVEKEPREKDGARVTRKRAEKQAPFEGAAAPMFSARLIDTLRSMEGSVLDLGVKVLGAQQFRAYESVLLRAWRASGGSDLQFAEHLRRGDVEILKEEGGYASGRSAGKRAAILEFSVHPFTLVEADV